MIRPLRQRHRRIVTALGVLLPAAFVVGIAARKPAPVMGALPALTSEPAKPFTKVAWSRDDLWPQQTMRTRLLTNAEGQFAMELSPGKDFVRPDVLVYWTPNAANAGDKLPNSAVLLGVFASGRQVPLPRDAMASSGALVLYSLADHEVVAESSAFIVR